MSKQEKLTKLLLKVRKFCQERNGKCLDGLGVIDAYAEFCKEMDDPPQPPEMPECVASLVAAIKNAPHSFPGDIRPLASKVAAYYRQPLKLEVGKVYKSVGEERVAIVHRSYSGECQYLGVCGTTTGWFFENGVSGSKALENLIREVVQ